MPPLSVRLSPSRFLDPALLLIVALGVVLYFAFHDAPPRTTLGRRARIAAWGIWGGLWAFSMPFVSSLLIAWTETRGPDLTSALAGRDHDKIAMVVLAGGIRTYDQSLPPRERLDAATSERVLTASRLWQEQRFGLVILSGAPPEETEGMRDLITTLGVPAGRVVLEDRSFNTRENALYSTEILRERGADTAVLVTSATHLRRAVKDFAAAGVRVIPAAAEVIGSTRTGIDSFLPSSFALARSHMCLHELLGYVRG